MYLDKTKCISFLFKLLGSVSLYGVTVFGVIVMKFHTAGYMEAADSKVNTRILTTYAVNVHATTACFSCSL